MSIAYLNGDYLPLDSVRISPMDRGFLFGDSIYETIPVYNGRLFRLTEHIQRLAHNLNTLQINVSFTLLQWSEILNTLILKNQASANQIVYLQITRGPNVIRDLAFPKQPCPTIFAYCQAVQHPSTATLEQGIHAITYPDSRWQHCDIKTTSLLANVLARQAALAQNAQEAIFINDNQQALEGSASNLFIVQNSKLLTPPRDQHVLGGVTRDLILELCLKYAIEIQEASIDLAALLTADEIWLTSSTKEIMPVVKLNHQWVHNGKPGPLWRRMIKYYQIYKSTLSYDHDAGSP